MLTNDDHADVTPIAAIFGATGTAGDGILKAVLNDPDVAQVHVVTRRTSPRIDAASASGRVRVTERSDFLEYSSIAGLLETVDTVYWALGTSAANVSKEQYGVIHVDYPVNLAKEWLNARPSGDLSFHLVSGMGVGSDAKMHWAREKARAEQSLFELAEGTNMRVIAHRPSYIAPAEDQANLGHNFLHAVLTPVNLAIRSTKIGEAMLEATATGRQLANGTTLPNSEMLKYAKAYRERGE